MSILANAVAAATTASWLGPALTGLITGTTAVAAVFFTQRAERRRAHDDRLWQQRVTAYADLLAWSNEVDAWSLRRRPRNFRSRTAKPEVVERALHARLAVVAGPEVTKWLELTETALENARDDDEHALKVHVNAQALADAVQQEILHLHVRSRREQRRLQIGSRSQQNLGMGAGPRYRPPSTHSEG